MSNFWKKLIKPDSGLAKFLLFAFVLFFFSLEFLPLLNPIKEFLDADALSLQIGTARFSAYLIIQGVIIIATLLWLTGFLSDIAAKFIDLENLKKNKKASGRHQDLADIENLE